MHNKSDYDRVINAILYIRCMDVGVELDNALFILFMSLNHRNKTVDPFVAPSQRFVQDAIESLYALVGLKCRTGPNINLEKAIATIQKSISKSSKGCN